MQKMKLEYAQKIMDGQYVFGNRMLSCRDNLLVVKYDEDEFPRSTSYYGTKLDSEGNLQTDSEGYVIFTQVKPVIDVDTRWTTP